MTISEKLEKGIRGLFCGALYFLFMATFLFCTKYALRIWWNVDYTLLGLIDWMFIISILIAVGVTMLYLTPILEKWLYNKAQSKIRALDRKPEERMKEKEAKRQDKAKDKELKRKEKEYEARERYNIPPKTQPQYQQTKKEQL